MTTSANPEDQEVYGSNLHVLRTGDGAPYPLSGTDNGDGTLSLNVNANITGGASNTVAPTNAGTTATTANPVQGVTGGVPMPVTATALPLPSGAATSAKQPALGTAGSASSDVLSVQGVTGGSPVSVTTTASGVGADTVFPTSISTSGTSLGNLPTGGRGLVVDIPPGASFSEYVAPTQAANSAAAATVAHTYSNPSTATVAIQTQFNLSGSQQVWVTQVTGGPATTFTSGLPTFRFI